MFDGLLLPIILVFVMLLARDGRLMGSLRSGRVLTVLGWLVTCAIAVLSISLVVAALLPASSQ